MTPSQPSIPTLEQLREELLLHDLTINSTYHYTELN